MVAEVIATVKGLAAARAFGVVAVVCILLRGGCVLVLVVAIEVRAALERFGVAMREQADDW